MATDILAPGYTPSPYADSVVGTPDKTYITPTPISVTGLQTPQTPINIQPAPTPTPVSGTVAGGNALLGANASILTPTQTAAPTAPDWFTQFMQSAPKPQSSADIYNTDYAASGIDAKQTDVNSKLQAVNDAQNRFTGINAQIQALNAEAQAIPTQVQNAAAANGRITTAAGLNADQETLLRQNALKQLPLQGQALTAQAEVAAAQGNAQLSQSILQHAQDHFDKVFQIHMQDAQNLYNYQKEIRDKVFQYATQKEQQQIAAKQKADDRAFDMKRDAINNAQELAKLATSNHQGVLAGKIASLNPDSPTFQQDLAKLQAQITPYVVAAAGHAPEVKTINGVDMQWNAKTGKWETFDNSGGTQAGVQKGKDQVNLVLSSLTSAGKLAGASGQSGLKRAIGSFLYGSTDYNRLVAETNTLRTNVLTMMTDPSIKKFFGPQMSNADVQLMTAAGTTLNPELQSPEDMKSELARLKDLTLRAGLAVDGAVQYSTAPDGTKLGRDATGRIFDAYGNQYDENGKRI